MSADLISVIDKYSTDEKCRRSLEQLRWPDGVVCPKCQSKKISRISTRNTFDCDSCRNQFSVTVGTIFNDTHLPLTKWFLATYIMVESKNGISANQLRGMLGISYKTAWYLCHRIRKAMTVIDKAAPPRTQGAITDDGNIYGRIDDRSTKHECVKHSQEKWVRGRVHTKGVANACAPFERSIVGSYHQISAKHMGAYLDEFEWRFNERGNPYLFRDTLIRLIKSPKMEFKELIEKST